MPATLVVAHVAQESTTGAGPVVRHPSRALSLGDVIRLDTRPEGSLPVLIAGQPKALGRLGRLGRQRALEITRI